MKKTVQIITGTIIVFFLLASILMANSNWEETKNKNGIRIETRVVDGSPMKEFRSETIIKAPLEVVFEVIRDSTSYSKWFGDCIIQKVVQEIDKDNRIGYQAIDLPFPFSDRDTIVMINFNKDWEAGRVTMTVKSIGTPQDARYGMDALTKEKGRVRMPKMTGMIQLTKINNDKTKMIYQAHADPGVALPSGLLNMLSTMQPYKTLSNIQKEVRNDKYYQRAAKVHQKTF